MYKRQDKDGNYIYLLIESDNNGITIRSSSNVVKALSTGVDNVTNILTNEYMFDNVSNVYNSSTIGTLSRIVIQQIDHPLTEN